MSLDVSLSIAENVENSGSGIFVREQGTIREISRTEWNQKFPDTEPITAQKEEEEDRVYWANITHNLNSMADAAGIYEYLWRPEEIGVSKADQLIKPLTKGLSDLRRDPIKFKKFDAENKWGTYPDLIRFVSEYLEACRKWPKADVSVSR